MLGAILAPAVSPAAEVIYNFDNVFSGVTVPSNPPWMTETFNDVSPGVVSLTISNTDLTGGEFIGGVYINIDPQDNVNSLHFSLVSQRGSFTDPTVNLGEDKFKADGDGYYDILLSFGTANGTTFGPGNSITYTLSGFTGLNALDFAYISTSSGGHGPFYSAAHVQGVGANSAWINPSQLVTIVPEPAPAAVFGFLGCFAFVLRSFRRRFKARA